MEIMNIVFLIVVGWLLFTNAGLYVGSGIWYYLIILLGAALSFSYGFVRDVWEFAGLLILIGPILIAAGAASAFTFGAKRELERVQASSWIELVFGIVPQHLRTGSIDTRNGIVLSSLGLFFALMLFVGGNVAGAINLAVLGVVAAFYAIWCIWKKG